MRSVVFSTESASFTFPLSEVTEHLSLHGSRFNLKEARKMLSFLSSSKEETVMIPESLRYSHFVVLDLVGTGIGEVFCRTCDRTYAAQELISQELGCGANPLRPKIKTKGGIFRIFTVFKRRRRVGMIGGKRCTCPLGHELLSMITWVT